MSMRRKLKGTAGRRLVGLSVGSSEHCRSRGQLESRYVGKSLRAARRSDFPWALLKDQSLPRA